MLLEIRTTIVLLLVSAILMILVLAQGTRGRQGDGLREWLLGLTCTTIAWALIALRAQIDPLFSVALADAVMLAGLCLFLGGLRVYGGAGASLWILLPAPVLFVLLVPFRNDFQAYTLVASGALSAALATLAVVTWRVAPRGTRGIMASVFFLSAVMLAGRAVEIHYVPSGGDSLFVRDVFGGATFLALFAMTIAGTFGFLEMLRNRAEDALRHLAMFDGLTRMLNRRAFLDLARREWRRAQRGSQSIALLMIDIDHFKRVNDTCGHATGDDALVQVGSAIRECLRSEDLLGRLGGEEFCVVLPGCTAGEARGSAERIRAAVSARAIPGVPWPVTVSVGVAACRVEDDGSIESLIKEADDALLEAKRTGRDRVVVASA